MAGVEFRVDRGDHIVVEDFVSRRPEGVSGIVVEARYIKRQADLIAATRDAGLDVIVETLTERLVAKWSANHGLEYGVPYPLAPVRDLADSVRRDAFVARVIELQHGVATTIVPPHFFVETEDELDLNVALVRRTRNQLGRHEKIRPILAAKREFLAQPGRARLAALRYRQEGVNALELRLSPLGDQNDGPRKVRSAMSILEAFQAEGLSVVLGLQGRIGETAVALGLADGYSVGVGYRETYDFKTMLNRQSRPEDKQEDEGGGPIAGVYLPGADLTVSRRLGKLLYTDTRIRAKLMCRIGNCADHIDGPSRDPRGHYLHSRAATASELLKQPPQWRTTLHQDRLTRAIELREIINKHMPADAPQLKSRLIETLRAEVAQRVAKAA